MNNKKPELITVFNRFQIAEKVGLMAEKINQAYAGKPLVAICVLKGAFIFFSDLVRAMNNPLLELDFVRLASYGFGTKSSGHVTFIKDMEIDIRSKHVLIVEDIVDSGHTMKFLLDQLSARGPLSLAIAAMVDKRERRVAPVEVAFSGFTLPGGFLVGYGLDYAEKFRSLPDICELVLESD